jgi:hypothetical protein
MQFEIVVTLEAPGLIEVLTAINGNIAALVAQGSQDAIEESAAKSISQATASLTSAIPAKAG